MKQCPRCRQTYSDEQLNFCLEDGELLSGFIQEPPSNRFADDAPTVLLDDARKTNPTNWPSSPPSSPLAQWEGQAINKPQPHFSPYVASTTPDQTLALVSLGLGIGSMTIGWCCSIGLLLSPAALVTGFIALSYIKKDPKKYSGRGFAIAGLVTAAVYVAIYILIIVIWGFSMLLGGLN